jgi:hypothetical protein
MGETRLVCLRGDPLNFRDCGGWTILIFTTITHCQMSSLCYYTYLESIIHRMRKSIMNRFQVKCHQSGPFRDSPDTWEGNTKSPTDILPYLFSCTHSRSNLRTLSKLLSNTFRKLSLIQVIIPSYILTLRSNLRNSNRHPSSPFPSALQLTLTQRTFAGLCLEWTLWFFGVNFCNPCSIDCHQEATNKQPTAAPSSLQARLSSMKSRLHHQWSGW